MRNAWAVIAAAVSAGFVAPAMAQEGDSAVAPDQPTMVMQAEDGDLTCAAIGAEAATLSDAMGGESGGGLFSRVGGAVKTGAATFIPGAGLVMAGASALTREDRERREAEERAQIYRWYYLNGLSSGRGCHEGGPREGADAATPAPRVSPSTN